jgi:hypothetical protein
MILKNNVRKTSFLLVLGLAILMVAAVSVNADRIMDEQVVDPIDSTIITHVSTEGERGEVIVEPVEKEEPLIIAPLEDIELEDITQNEDLVISPYDETIGIDDDNPENSLIATKTEKTDKNTINYGLPAVAGIGIICGLLIFFLLIKRKK